VAVAARSIVDEAQDDSPPGRVRRCHRFAADRVDCEVEERPVGSRATCGWLVSTHVAASGLLRSRGYRCPGTTERLFRRSPRWNNKPAWVIVSDVRPTVGAA
jgi:hypothetical protein